MKPIKKVVFGLVFFWFAAYVAAQVPVGTEPGPGQGGNVSNPTVPGIGVDYLVYDTGTYNPEAPSTWPGNNWYVPGHNFKTPIGLYQLNPGMVNQQLANMRASGMDWITIQIQISNLHCETDGTGSCNDGFVDGIWGEVNDYDHYYALWPQTQQNLRDLLTQIRALGFRYVVVRFMNYSPGVNNAFDETNYQAAWNMIVKARSLVYSQLAGGMTKPLFDLDGEGPGSPDTVRKQYDQRLWSDYTYTFGNDDTVGFSIIADDYHLTNGLPWFGSIKPKIYAFDIYGDVGAGLLKAWSALGAEQGKPILLMETYYNDAQTASQIQSTLAAHPGIHLMGILQWETTRETPCDGCSTVIRGSVLSALNSTGQTANYAPVLSKLAAETSNAVAISASDESCAATTKAVCEVKLSMNPTGGAPAYKVYVHSPGETPKLWTCQGVSYTGIADWIKRNTAYQFTYFRVNSCNDNVGTSPDAEATLSVRY
jgi:hypothetical protein